jgi:hypothetical protein
MNTAIIVALLNNPSVLIGKFIAEPLAGAALAYGLVWLAMRPKDGRKVGNPLMWHSIGITTTVIGSSLFRIVAMATFAGRNAYEPVAESGGSGFYLLIIPAVVAAAYIAWLKNASPCEAIAKVQSAPPVDSDPIPLASFKDAGYVPTVPVAADFTKVIPPENSLPNPLQAVVDEERVYAEIAQELETGIADKGLWTRLFVESGGDEKQTKVLYIKQRAVRLIAAEGLRLEQARASREHTAETMRLEELRLQSLEQEEKLVADPVSSQPAITNIPSVSQSQDERKNNDEFAGWILMAIIVGITLVTAALM